MRICLSANGDALTSLVRAERVAALDCRVWQVFQCRLRPLLLHKLPHVPALERAVYCNSKGSALFFTVINQHKSLRMNVHAAIGVKLLSVDRAKRKQSTPTHEPQQATYPGHAHNSVHFNDILG
eukprot:4120793-Amphidinium_carterae.1